ncbi:putative sorting nexin [Helianthus annuus]|nr:putative sorting nexin [Helianthus annuus]KAJ0763154.1 putative sorting nexin [Helianthus annuus]KAJ0933486.1 putative sorting nexin [Helianthus annuus]
MSTTLALDPTQQPPPYPPVIQEHAYKPHSGHGSVGPVLGVLAVVMVLGAVAIMIGRLCSGRRVMGHVQYDFEGWMETKCATCIDGRLDPPPPPETVPPVWSPPNVSVPLLNLVDKIFQLKRRGWLRRQVFWISKQILQLMMEDAIDDWLLRQIHFLRRDNIVAQGIHMLQDILWPEGTFFLKSRTSQTDSSQSNEGSGNKNNKQGSFEEQLEAARRASDIKKMIFKGAPTTLVSLIGRKQYKRSAKDIYYFLQSAVCLKQLGYGLLELALMAIFPELQGIILNVHEKKKEQVV